MLFCLESEYQVPSYWRGISAPSLLTLCPTHNLSKVHWHTADMWALLFWYSWHHLHPDLFIYFFFCSPKEHFAHEVRTFHEHPKKNKVNNGAIHKRRCDFPPFFFCRTASKRPSMTSALATVKTFRGPDGSAPDYWVFLSRASEGKFSELPLSLLIQSSPHILLSVAAALATCVHIQCIFWLTVWLIERPLKGQNEGNRWSHPLGGWTSKWRKSCIILKHQLYSTQAI